MKIGQHQLSFLCVLLFSTILGICLAERFSEGTPPFVFAELLFTSIIISSQCFEALFVT